MQLLIQIHASMDNNEVATSSMGHATNLNKHFIISNNASLEKKVAITIIVLSNDQQKFEKLVRQMLLSAEVAHNNLIGQAMTL